MKNYENGAKKSKKLKKGNEYYNYMHLTVHRTDVCAVGYVCRVYVHGQALTWR